MKDTILKNRDIIKLERRGGGKPHTLFQYEKGSNKYIFCPAEEWMPVYVTGEHDDIFAIDSDGGPMICVGDKVKGRHVSKIYYEEGIGYIVEFE